MTAFLEDISPFYGNKERNEKGETLEEFLDVYNPKHYEQPSVTVDILVVQHPKDFQNISDGIKVLMIQRGNHPSIGKWALPGGFIHMREDAIESAKRELEEETGLTGIPIEQIHTWGEWQRDPRSRIVTIAYLACVQEGLHPKAGDDAEDAAFFDAQLILTSDQTAGKKHVKIFQIALNNKAKGVSLTATLRQTENIFGFIRQRELEILENDGFAGDHGKIIGDGLLYIKELLEKYRWGKNIV